MPTGVSVSIPRYPIVSAYQIKIATVIKRGDKASYIVEEKYCSKCRKKDRCECIENISPNEVKEKLMKLILK